MQSESTDMKRLRGAIAVSVLWAIAWAIGGLLVGASSVLFPALPWDAFFAVWDAPLPALAVPGFVGGAIFSVVLGIAARRRRIDELSLARVATWGALGGLLLALVPAALVGIGMAHLDASGAGLWRLTATIAIPAILLCTLSACGSLLLARRGIDRAADDELLTAR